MERLDKTLYRRGLATSRAHAQRLIDAGRVSVNGRVERKASSAVADADQLAVEPGEEDRYVSRGGLKLAAALARGHTEVNGCTVLDVGQSTGGFTDCLLQAGAACVVGVDVGHQQLVSHLRDDARVVCYEGVNARHLPAELVATHSPGGFSHAVIDVSFISQTLILPALVPLLAPDGWLISLVKPQFEVGRDNLGKGGIVRDPALYGQVEKSLRNICGELGLAVRDYFESPITGGDGNREFLLLATKIEL